MNKQEAAKFLHEHRGDPLVQALSSLLEHLKEENVTALLKAEPANVLKHQGRAQMIQEIMGLLSKKQIDIR